MIYLNAGLFKPFFILSSLLMLPMVLVLAVLCIFEFNISVFFISLIFFAIYLASIVWAYRQSMSRKDFLYASENCITIKYPNLNGNKGELTLEPNQIVMIEYYRIGSIRAWCMSFDGALPQCAEITYMCNGKKLCQSIGYPNLGELSALCAELGIKLVLK